MEQWKSVRGFPKYSVSNHGRFRKDKTGLILALTENQYGVVCVGLMRDGQQYHRSVPLLVAKAFIPHKLGAFDTAINKDGDRYNNHVENLTWRPRWFAVKYNRQFRTSYPNRLHLPIQDITTGEIWNNSFECAKEFGLLEEDVVLSIMNRTLVWPTYQQFRIVD
jgi:hypothetical protein